MGKATYQLDSATRFSFMFNRNLKDRFHRRDSPYLFVEGKKYPCCRTSRPRISSRTSTATSGGRSVVDLRFGRMWGIFPTRYQREVGPNDISIIDSERFTRINAATEQSLNPNHRYQLSSSVNYFRQNLLGGTHDFKVGVQLSRERNGLRPRSKRRSFSGADERARSLRQPRQYACSVRSSLPHLGVLRPGPLAHAAPDGQCRGSARRHTRVHPRSSRARRESLLATGPFRRFDDVPSWTNVAPRVGASYDLSGNGRTAIKGYAGRFYNQIGSEILESVNPNARVDIRVPWNDANANLRLDPGEYTFAGFSRGIFPTFDTDSNRPYSDELNFGVDHTLRPNLAVSVSYHHRRHRSGLGIIDRARPTSAYTPVTRSFVDPVLGQSQTIAVYSLDPAR